MLDPELGELVRLVVEAEGFVRLGKRLNRYKEEGKDGWYVIFSRDGGRDQWFIALTLEAALEAALEERVK